MKIWHFTWINDSMIKEEWINDSFPLLEVLSRGLWGALEVSDDARAVADTELDGAPDFKFTPLPPFFPIL